MLFDTFFDYPSRPQVVVISETAIREAQKKQLETELTALQSKANRYHSALEELDLAIVAKEKEITGLAAAAPEKLDSKSAA